MGDMIRIKPHHVVDILVALGTGRRSFEPHPYGHAVHTVSERIVADPDILLEMELGADDICRPCVHHVQGLCDDVIDTSFRPLAPSSKRDWNLLLDRRWCERLGLAQGDRLTARRFARLANERAGDITDIYREIPADRTRVRAATLAAGIEWILNANPA